MKDAQGNDLGSVAVPVTGAICLVKYDPQNVITPEMIAVTKDVPELPAAYDRTKACLGLITSDGGPQDASDQDDAIEFYQQGYSLNAQPTLTTAFTLAEDNALTRRVSYGVEPDEYGVYHVATLTPDEKWMAYQEETLKNGQVTRRAGVVQVTGNEPGQSERGSVKGRALTVTWQPDPLYGNVPYIEAPYRPDENTPTVEVEAITVDKPTLAGVAGGTETITATITPTEAAGTTITAVSDHPDIADATVNGTLVAVQYKTTGNAVITLTAGTKTATIQVTVTAAPVPVTGVTLDPTELTVDKGKTAKITATLEPEDATDTEIEWTSDHEDIATVDAGTVTGVAAGEATITATTHDGNHTATVTVTVNNVPDPLTVTATARIGGQTVTVTEAVDAGLQRRYHLDQKAPSIAYDQVVDTASGWQPLPDNGEITGKDGQTVTVVDNTVEGAKARKVGTATLPAPLTAVYYGCVNTNTAADLTADAIKALTAKSADGSAAGDYEYTPDATANNGDGQYTLLAQPAAWDDPTFTMSNLAYPVDKLTQNVTIDDVSYEVWTSTNQMTEKLTVKVA